MKTYIYIKPESSHLNEMLLDSIDEMSHDSAYNKKLLELIKEGVEILSGKAKETPSPEIDEVITGVLTDQMFSNLYPNFPNDERALCFRSRVVGNVFSLVILDVPTDDAEQFFGEMAKIKGKMGSREGAVGLRGSMKRRYESIGVEKLGFASDKELYDGVAGVNFIHMPDNLGEAMAVVDFFKKPGNFSGQVLYRNTNQNQK